MQCYNKKRTIHSTKINKYRGLLKIYFIENKTTMKNMAAAHIIIRKFILPYGKIQQHDEDTKASQRVSWNFNIEKKNNHYQQKHFLQQRLFHCSLALYEQQEKFQNKRHVIAKYILLTLGSLPHRDQSIQHFLFYFFV